MLGKKITVTVAQPEVQLAGEGRKVLYKGSVALGDHSSPKPVYLISYGDPKPEQPATVIAVVSSKGKEQFVAAPENTVYYAPEIRSVIEKAEGRPPERVSCLYEKSCGAVVYRVEGRTVRFLVVKNKNGRHWGFPKGHMEYGESERQTALREVLEETGLQVEEAVYQFSLPNTYLYSGFLVHTLDQFFLCKVKDTSRIKAMDDVAESFWLPLDEVNPEEFGLDSVREGVRRFLKEHKL